jgi:UDP-galactopyranose mutase
MKKKLCFVGAGFSSAVTARELADSGNFDITIFESRNHVAGNCHTERQNGIMVHKYGPHIFNTSRKDVWEYVNKFGKFMPFINRVKAYTNKGVFSLPINLLTINQFFNKNFTPDEARTFVNSLGDSTIIEPNNFEEQALKFLGPELYQIFFYGYTKKQWGVEPSSLPSSILKRLPVRFNYDDNYYQQLYQGIPVDGYTELVNSILNHKSIHVIKNTTFIKAMSSDFDHVFYSGPIDSYFDYSKGRLRYRTLKFEKIEANGDYQGNAVINYCSEKVPFTRISEHKHFAPWERHDNTLAFKEYSSLATPNDNPYYPLRLNEDLDLLSEYVNLANMERGLTFIGRLGTYRYLDMHVVIGEALDSAKYCIANPIEIWPAFFNSPI